MISVESSHYVQPGTLIKINKPLYTCRELHLEQVTPDGHRNLLIIHQPNLS